MQDIFGDSHLIVLCSDPAPRGRCSECEEMHDLLVFSTARRGGRGRTRAHEGAFCSKPCHDEHHELKPRDRRVDARHD